MHGSRLRLPQVTPADSGEYVCRVASGSGTQEASVLVKIQQRLSPTHSESLRDHGNVGGAARGQRHLQQHPCPAFCLTPQPRVWCILSVLSLPQPHWPMGTPWTSTAWLPATPPIPSPGISVEAAYRAGIRYGGHWHWQEVQGDAQYLALSSFSHSTSNSILAR